MSRSRLRRRSQRRRGRLQKSLGVLGITLIFGFVGYVALGLDPLEAAYQTVITGTTVGYREIGEVDTAYQLFTIVFIFFGVGSALYTLTVLFETIVDGRLEALFGRRRMEREINQLDGHLVLCGAGRVGKVLAAHIAERQQSMVVIDTDPDSLSVIEELGAHVVLGDARDDAILRASGIERAATLVAALTSDADNVYVSLAARALNPELFLVARAHSEGAEPKLRQAGADRVVNPQSIGGHRMATFALQPNVAEFLDVVMHDDEVEWRLEEVEVLPGSELLGLTLAEADLRRRCGVLVLAMRHPGSKLETNPDPGTLLGDGTVLISMGLRPELAELERLAGRP
ncbi:MAG: potassium channel protein [Actinomycetota bacterium]